MAILGSVACADPELIASSDTDIREELVDPSFEEHIEPMFKSCLACHQGEAPDGGFDLTGDMYARLVEQRSIQAESLNLVEPGDSAYSYLWHKLNGSQSLAGGAGTRMPMG